MASPYHIDWSSTFTAGPNQVTLDRTPLPPDPAGKSWGGYAGLSIRYAANLAERQAVATSGPVQFDQDSLHRSNSMAMDYNGLIQGGLIQGELGEGELGEGGPAGIAILDHPDNPRHPTPWYAIRSKMSYLNAAFLTHQPYTLEAGSSFQLRYRIVVHRGQAVPT